jgi:hypothetical protein
MTISSPSRRQRRANPARASWQSRAKWIGVVVLLVSVFHLQVQLCRVSFSLKPVGYVEEGR